ncbi:hypothetical protein [Vibrio sp. MA40-2]|uniref:hypothetical protein n=1 Tax=Vibrio sp. MA40-2 TaxID=3391828 RepID=UPI0039A641EE
MKNKNGCIFSIREASRSKVSLAISGVLLLVVNPTQADEFIPQLKAHGKPSPFEVMPLYDLNQPGGELPYVQPQAEPIQGAIDTVVHSSSRTAVVGTSYNSATGGHETFADVRKKGSKFYGRAIIVEDNKNPIAIGTGYNNGTLKVAEGYVYESKEVPDEC